MKIAVDLHFSNLKDGLYTDMGSEGRWATNWAKLLAENGHQVHCICSENVHGWGNTPPVQNIYMEPRVTQDHYDIAFFPDQSIPDGLNTDFKIFMHFSPLTITSKDRALYEPDNSIIVYPVEIQFTSTREAMATPYRYNNKTYFLPTPMAEKMEIPNYNRQPSIVWTNRWGPGITSDINFNSFINLINKHNLHTTIFSYQNFYVHASENEGEEGIRKLRESLGSIQSLETIKSSPVNQLMDKLKTTKFAVSTHGGGMGGSMYEQIICGTFPLPCTTTSYIFPHIDKKLYENPYPSTVDEIVKTWEIPLLDESFYISALKEYQKEAEPYLYSNCLNRLSKILLEHGFKL